MTLEQSAKETVLLRTMITKELHKSIHHQAIEEERSVNAVIEDAIRLYLKEVADANKDSNNQQ